MSGLGGGFIVAAILYLAVFLLAPDAAAGGQLIVIRLAAYPLFALLLWWASLPLTRESFHRLSLSVAAVALPSLLAMLALDVVNYQNVNRYLTEFEAVTPHVADNSTLLPVHFDNFTAVEPSQPHYRIAVGVDPFRHAAANGLAEKV